MVARPFLMAIDLDCLRLEYIPRSYSVLSAVLPRYRQYLQLLSSHLRRDYHLCHPILVVHSGAQMATQFSLRQGS